MWQIITVNDILCGIHKEITVYSELMCVKDNYSLRKCLKR